MTKTNNASRPAGQRAIWLVISGDMSMRMLLSTRVADEIRALCGEQFDLVVVSEQSRPKLTTPAFDIRHVPWAELSGSRWERSRVRRGLRSFVSRSANFRFDHINGFKKHRSKRLIDRAVVRTHSDLLTQDDSRPAYLGFPWPGSRRLLRVLARARESKLLTFVGSVERMFEDSPPAIVISASCQAIQTFDFARAACRLGIPTVGVVSSWDNLTLRGPVGSFFDEYWVWNHVMASELLDYHGVEADRIRIVGSPLFDIHRGEGPESSAKRVGKELSIPEEARVILLAADTWRLGHGEPSIARHLCNQIEAGSYGDREIVVIIRSHPRDPKFHERFGRLSSHPRIRLYAPPSLADFDLAEQREDLATLSGMIARSDVVLCGAGTIALDASCQDKPIVSLRFDGTESLPDPISARIRFDSDHYDRFIRMGGTAVVDSFEELNAAVVSAFNDSFGRAVARANVRDTYAEWNSIASSSRLIADRIGRLLETRSNEGW